jgi:hypothetical protein
MTPINTLPDDALLEIFDFYMKFSQHDKISTVYFCGTSNVSKEEIEAWQTLVHVCRLWRNIVFGSPRRLNLRLVCTPETPLSNVQDIWPALPLCIHDCMEYPTKSAYDIIAAFGHDRICQLLIRRCKWWELGELWAAMQVPFPELTVLDINPFDPFQGTPVIPDSFLGGSAPRLRSLYLFRIPFPGLPKLLSSATHLVTLRLCEIPISGYISPESMANCLSVLTSLHDLIILFKPDQYLPDRETRRLSPPIRSVLPALTEFDFGGNNEYLEDLIARIDLPRLKNLRIVFPEQTHYEISQLLQLISRTPSFDTPEKAILDFNFYNFGITLLSQRPGTGVLTVKILNVRPYRFTDQRFWPWHGSVPRPCLSFPRWRTSFSASLNFLKQNGKTTSRAHRGWNFYVFLLL